MHTPHLEDKKKGTRLIMDAIKRNTNLDPGRVLIDHVEEHTVREVLDNGFWADNGEEIRKRFTTWLAQ